MDNQGEDNPRQRKQSVQKSQDSTRLSWLEKERRPLGLVRDEQQGEEGQSHDAL